MMTRFVYDGSNMVAELTDDEEVIATYLYGTSLVNQTDDTGEKHYYFFNAHGDVVAITNETGHVEQRYEYNAYGEDFTYGEEHYNPLKYFGQYYDFETENYYLRARYYNPSLMRFINEDIYTGNASNLLSLNRYTYCYGNPVLYLDYSGRDIRLPTLNEIVGVAEDILDFGNPFFSEASPVLEAVAPYAETIIDIGEMGTDAVINYFTWGFFGTEYAAIALNMYRDGKGIWHANYDCWQDEVGYNDYYDYWFDIGTSMTRAKFEFVYNGDELIFWAWKGDYTNLGMGAELGIYRKYSDSENLVHWVVDKSYALPMTLKLMDKSGNTIIDTFDPGIENHQWWITAFNPEIKNINADDLVAIYTIDFRTDTDMYHAFVESDTYTLNKDMFTESQNYVLEFTFDRGVE